MNNVEIFKVIQEIAGEEKATRFVNAMKENGNLATKLDLKELELRIEREFKMVFQKMNSQIVIFLSGLALMPFVFKVVGIFIN